MEPVKTMNISIFDEERFEQASYEVTTIIPYIPIPEMLVYRMTHKELEDFFDGYNETAEFVISVRPNWNEDDVQAVQ